MAVILLVDDEEPIRITLKEILERRGYTCITAGSAEEARECLKGQAFELVLMDIRLPDESGMNLMKYIHSAYPNCAVVMVTAVENMSVAREAIQEGAYDYINKPIERDRMLISLVNALHRRELEVANRTYREGLEEIVAERAGELQSRNKELEETIQCLQETQSQMVHAEKMASIGQLSAGIAHEINNPAGYVYSNLLSMNKYIKRLLEILAKYDEALKSLQNNSEVLTEVCEEIEGLKKNLKIDFITDDMQNLVAESMEGMERLKKIVADLKSFSRADQEKLKHADINEGIESTLNVVWNELKYKCTVEKDYGELPLTYCNLGQLNQVFMNLLVNAAHAIEKQGTIKIATRYVETEGTQNSGNIVVRVSDTGSGIPEDKCSRIFEPFFTTKEVGKGTGLGLSIAYDIIQKHDGTIEVDSEVGKGTTFIITLPRVQERKAERGDPGA